MTYQLHGNQGRDLEDGRRIVKSNLQDFSTMLKRSLVQKFSDKKEKYV